MKKFKFTLQKYLEMKEDREEELKRELGKITAEINEVIDKISDIENKEYERREEYTEKSKTGVTGSELHEYSFYMAYLHDVFLELTEKLNNLTKKSDEYKERLIVLTNEIKAINKMKDEQYRAYLKEIQDEETRQIDEFVSYQAYSSL